MIEQGNNFYMQLNDALIKLQYSINDYKMSRDMQKNDFIKSQGGGAGGPGAGAGGAGMMQPGMQQM